MAKFLRKYFTFFSLIVVITAVSLYGVGVWAFSTSSDKKTVTVASFPAADVKLIQTKLQNWGYYTGKIDGIYGAQTTKAVKTFQNQNGLLADGIVGSKTAIALGIKLAQNSSDSDWLLLAKVIYAEAKKEPYTAQVAVGAVLLNRVASGQFPNSLAGVVYQPGACKSMQKGKIIKEPDSIAKAAARDALNGWDPSLNALYYYNPKTEADHTLFTRKTIVTLGFLRFCA